MESLLLVKVLSLIAGMCALGYVVYKVLKKNSAGLRRQSSGFLTIVEYQRVDQKTSLCLIKAHDQHYLLAIGQDAICLEKIPVKSE